MAEERLKLAVFIDFDNIQIGVKETLAKEFDVSVVLEALKERGEVVSKIAYGDWSRAGDQGRQMTQHAVQMQASRLGDLSWNGTGTPGARFPMSPGRRVRTDRAAIAPTRAAFREYHC